MYKVVEGHVPAINKDNYRGKGGQYGLVGSMIMSIRISLKTILLIIQSVTNQFLLN